MKKPYVIVASIIIFALGVGIYVSNKNRSQSPSPTSPKSGQFDIQEGVKSPKVQDEGSKDIEIIAENLEIPWEVAFLPSGEMLVTERPGRLLKIGQDRTIIQVSGVRHVGEGGLLGMALHPDFENNQLIYLYLTSSDAGKIVNRVERYKLEGNSLTNRKVILEGIEGASNHDGGRIEFGPPFVPLSGTTGGKPDYFLYITTGDAQKPDLAQDTNSLNGKILRIKDDGSIPSDNPFGNAVYSYGHRNVQGLAWDGSGRLWATEHGRSGVLSGLDELNLIEPGKNYGWPEIEGDEKQTGMVNPIIHSGASETWAPADAEFVKGSIFFAGLRGVTLYEAKLSERSVTTLVKHLSGEYGRLRGVRLGPDGFLYITTSNRDGRGQVRQGDDKLIRINPRIFK